MAKKLTKREWYEAAQFWCPEGYGDNQQLDIAVTCLNKMREINPGLAHIEWPDIACISTQFCLEKAGL